MNKVATKSKYTIFDGNLTLAWSELESQIKELLMFSVQQLLDLEKFGEKGRRKILEWLKTHQQFISKTFIYLLSINLVFCLGSHYQCVIYIP